MLWRVRTTLADRPGSLAELARRCGEQSVNILGLQIFPGVEGVTDELVLRSPRTWAADQVAGLVTQAGGAEVGVAPCTERALADGPTSYLHAVRTAALDPTTAEELLARLLGGEPGSPATPTSPLTPAGDVLEAAAGGRRVRVRRSTPFTPTEHARAAAFVEALADLVDQVPAVPVNARSGAGAGTAVRRPGVVVREATPADAVAVVLMHDRCSAESIYRHYSAPMARPDLRLARRLITGGSGALVAADGEAVVGLATVGAVAEGACELGLLVEDGRQRQGIGSRLLGAAVRRAAAAGASEAVLRGPVGSEAAVALVFASGMAARMRLDGDELVVTVPTRGVHPVGDGPAPVRR